MPSFHKLFPSQLEEETVFLVVREHWFHLFLKLLVWIFFAAVMVLFAFMVTVAGLVFPVKSPPHPVNEYPALGTAVRVTLVPSLYLGWSGDLVTLPPEPVTVIVYVLAAKLAAIVWFTVTFVNV